MFVSHRADFSTRHCGAMPVKSVMPENRTIQSDGHEYRSPVRGNSVAGCDQRAAIILALPLSNNGG